MNWLLRHTFLSIRRSPDLQRKVIVNIIFGFLMFILAAELFLAGFFMRRIITEDLMPGSDPVAVFNGVLMYYFGMEFIMRLMFQGVRSAAGKQYLLLRASRKKIAHFILLKTSLSLVSLIPLLVAVPFCFNGVAYSHSMLSSCAWLIMVMAVMLMNTYMANYAKLRFYTSPVKTILAVGVLAALVLLEKLHVISLTWLSRTLFGFVLDQPAFVLVPFAGLAVVYLLNHRLLYRHSYLDDIMTVKNAGGTKQRFGFLQKFGLIGALIRLDLRLMLRNKRTRISLWMPALFVFYGLMFYPSGHYSGEGAGGGFALLFIGMFITGFFIMSYGMTTFCYESAHFGVVLTNRISMHTYLKARWYFMLAMSLPVYILSSFYAVYGIKIIIVNSIMFLFNIGVTTFFFLFLATYNKIKFDLNAGAMSQQGKGSNQYIAVFAMLIFILIVYLPLRLLFGEATAFGALGTMGVLGIVFHNNIIRLLVKQFERRKYIMSEGFRQT